MSHKATFDKAAEAWSLAPVVKVSLRVDNAGNVYLQNDIHRREADNTVGRMITSDAPIKVGEL